MEARSVQTAFRFRSLMLTRMKNKARRQGVSLNAYVESLVQKDLDRERDCYEDLFVKISSLKVNENALETLNSRIASLNIHITPSEIQSDERLSYILSK